MKCNKALDLYFASRDGALNEAEGLELTRHLAHCPSCALFVKEMDASLDAIDALPELAASDGFEWNVKRRILKEKSMLMRRENVLPFGERRWMSRFVAGAAAAAVIVVIAAVVTVQRLGAPLPAVKEVARESLSNAPSIQVSSAHEGAVVDYAATGYYAGPRMVSDNIYTVERGVDLVRESPFQAVEGSREDSLARENGMLKRRIESLERQNVWLKGLLDKERMQRLNMSLP